MYKSRATQAVIAVRPMGIGQHGLRRWQTEPMTMELSEEIARVRVLLGQGQTGLSDGTQAGSRNGGNACLSRETQRPTRGSRA